MGQGVGAEGRRRCEIGLVECLPQRRKQQAVNLLGVAEAHFDLGRMYVDVDVFGGHFDEYKSNRPAPLLEQAAIGLPQ